MSLDAWRTSSPGPFVTVSPRGPWQPARVIISVAAEAPEREPGRLPVDATWTRDRAPRCASTTLDNDYGAARRAAHAWADLLAAGREPDDMGSAE